MDAMKDIRLWGILLLALAVRTAMLFSVFEDVHRAETPDSYDYEHLASWWLGSGDYQLENLAVMAPWDGLPTPRPEIFRAPGYPALLGGAEWVDAKTHAYNLAVSWNVPVPPTPPSVKHTDKRKGAQP